MLRARGESLGAQNDCTKSNAIALSISFSYVATKKAHSTCFPFPGSTSRPNMRAVRQRSTSDTRLAAICFDCSSSPRRMMMRRISEMANARQRRASLYLHTQWAASSRFTYGLVSLPFGHNVNTSKQRRNISLSISEGEIHLLLRMRRLYDTIRLIPQISARSRPLERYRRFVSLIAGISVTHYCIQADKGKMIPRFGSV